MPSQLETRCLATNRRFCSLHGPGLSYQCLPGAIPQVPQEQRERRVQAARQVIRRTLASTRFAGCAVIPAAARPGEAALPIRPSPGCSAGTGRAAAHQQGQTAGWLFARPHACWGPHVFPASAEQAEVLLKCPIKRYLFSRDCVRWPRIGQRDKSPCVGWPRSSYITSANTCLSSPPSPWMSPSYASCWHPVSRLKEPGSGGGDAYQPLQQQAEGLDAVCTELLHMVPCQPRKLGPKFLFAIDHCFPIKGQGTVLTGTVLQVCHVRWTSQFGMMTTLLPCCWRPAAWCSAGVVHARVGCPASSACV